MSFATSDLTHDKFLDGRLMIHQPIHGYRAGGDPVLLAAFVPAKPGQSVLELGCGVGVASLCLGWRVGGLSLTGVELQQDYAELARRNGAENGMTFDVRCADLRALPQDLRARGFDHVISNPPYFQRSRGPAACDPGRDTALAGDTPLDVWIDVAARRLEPKGYLTLIQDVRRMPELLVASTNARLGSIEILPISARQGRAPHLIMMRARKNGRADFRLHAPFVMHVGDRHKGDFDSYTPEVADIQRRGAALIRP